jgi:hypothetical protein
MLAGLFWCGVLLLVDGSVGLLFYDRWQRRLGSFNLWRWIWIEIAMALVLLSAYGMLRWIGG